MFFRRNEGEFRETDRVTRFKLIKSGKNWLRAATSNFGLFKVVKGGADAPSVTVQNVEEKSSLLSVCDWLSDVEFTLLSDTDSEIACDNSADTDCDTETEASVLA